MKMRTDYYHGNGIEIHLFSWPATETRFIQYLLPLRSGKLCPKCVPTNDTASPLARHLTFSQTTSSSLKDGQPWAIDSSKNS